MVVDWKARLDKGEQALRKLESLRTAHADLKHYLASEDVKSLTERHIEIAVEVVIDFANLLIAQKGWPRPASAPKAIRTLVSQRALSASLGQSLIS